MKDKTIAGLIAIFFGWIGLHYIYLGKHRMMFFILVAIAWTLIRIEGYGYLMVIAIVEAFDGVKLLQMGWHEFNNKYNREKDKQ